MQTVLDSANGRFGCMAVTAMTTPVDDEVARATGEYREQLRSGFLAVAERARALGEAVPEPAVAANLMTSAVLGALTVARAAPGSPELAAQLEALRAFVNGWRDA
jgi:hypothetical protein